MQIAWNASQQAPEILEQGIMHGDDAHYEEQVAQVEMPLHALLQVLQRFFAASPDH